MHEPLHLHGLSNSITLPKLMEHIPIHYDVIFDVFETFQVMGFGQFNVDKS